MAKKPKTKASTTAKTKQISIRVPNDIFSRLAAASGIGGDRTQWIINAITEKLDKQVAGIKDTHHDVPVCDSKPFNLTDDEIVTVTFKNVPLEVMDVIAAMRKDRTAHSEIAGHLNDLGFVMANGRPFTANSGCIKNYDKKFKELNESILLAL